LNIDQFGSLTEKIFSRP